MEEIVSHTGQQVELSFSVSHSVLLLVQVWMFRDPVLAGAAAPCVCAYCVKVNVGLGDASVHFALFVLSACLHF